MTTTERDYSLIERIDGVHQRLERARQLLADGAVRPIKGLADHFTVDSTDGSQYLINSSCGCGDYQYRQALNNGHCKHRLAVTLYQEMNGGN